jgi:hypothetical protein
MLIGLESTASAVAELKKKLAPIIRLNSIKSLKKDCFLPDVMVFMFCPPIVLKFLIEKP